MSERIELSAKTWIVNDRLHTTASEVRECWPILETQDFPTSPVIFYIPLTSCWEIYRYRGEGPWSRVTREDWDAVWLMVECDVCPRDARDDAFVIYLDRRAALVCDNAVQFRAFYEAIKPDGAGHTKE